MTDTVEISVTAHAVDRYVERVDQRLTWEQARAAISAHRDVCRLAVAFGCRVVRLGNGAQLVLDGASVVTVLAKGQRNKLNLPPRLAEIDGDDE